MQLAPLLNEEHIMEYTGFDTYWEHDQPTALAGIIGAMEIASDCYFDPTDFKNKEWVKVAQLWQHGIDTVFNRPDNSRRNIKIDD